MLHEPAGPAPRIVSLVPSLTELLCDLGLADRLVGRTGFCVHPREAVAAVPKVGGTKDVKLDRIRELAPTHVVVNVDENRLETARELAAFVPHVVVTHPLGPRDNLTLYRLLGGIFGREREAAELCARLERELARVERRPFPPETVLYLIWRDPWMTVGRDTYISRVLALVGWRTVPVDGRERYPVVDPAAAARQADRVLLASEPYRFRERHVEEVARLTGAARVSTIDAGMVSWYGSRAIPGLRYLREYASARRRETVAAAR